jgi:phenylpyruvate tautomerase PptA (4-oxalocrotonate tautomerase family)
MPLVRVALPAGKPAAFRGAVSDGIHAALIEAFGIPADDRFQILTDAGPGTEIVRPEAYLGIAYSDDLVIIQITANEGRTVEQKKALYQAIADRLAADPGLRREDIMISLVEVKRENWSFGNGVAQYAS